MTVFIGAVIALAHQLGVSGHLRTWNVRFRPFCCPKLQDAVVLPPHVCFLSEATWRCQKKNKRQATLTSSFTANGSFKNKSVCTSGENGHPRQTGKSEANAATNGYDLYKALGGLEARQGETRFERGDKTAVNCCTSFHFLVTFSCKVCDLGASVDKVSVVDSSQIPDSAAFYP